MGEERVACIWLEGPRIQACRVERATLRGAPVALIDRRRGRLAVVACSAEAGASGVRPGMRPSVATACCEDLEVVSWSALREARLQSSLLGLLEDFSPRFDSPGLGLAYLDARGLGGAAGEGAWLEALRARTASEGMEARVAIAGSRFTARAAACFVGGRETRVTPGGDALFLRGVSVAALPVEASVREALELAGLKTLGAFAAVPREALQARFGRQALWWHALAQGRDDRPVGRMRVERALSWSVDVEGVGLTWERLIFVVKRGLDALCGELIRCGRVTDEAVVWLRDGDAEPRRWRLELTRPAARSAPLLDRLRVAWDRGVEVLDGVGARLVLGVDVTPRVMRAASGELFAAPESRGEALAAAVARIESRLGAERVFALSRAETWHPQHQTSKRPFDPRGALGSSGTSVRRGGAAEGPVLMAVRPPQRVSVEITSGRPQVLRGETGGEARLRGAWGPFRWRGSWWSASHAYDRSYWMCLDGSGGLWRLYEEEGAWWMDGFWD